MEFVAARCRPNTVAATRSDLRVFFSVIDKAPVEVTPADVLAFIAEQRRPRGDGKVVRLADGEAGLSARTIKRRLATRVGVLRLSGDHRGGRRRTRCPGGWRPAGGAGAAACRWCARPARCPRCSSPARSTRLLGALRRWRDRAMVEAMVLGGLRRCEVLGLRLEDLRPVERRVFIAEGKGGHQRLVPISARFFASVARYLDAERPPEATTDRVFVVLKGPRRGRPLIDGRAR